MKHLGAVRDWIVDLDQDLDVDSNVVLDGDVDVDSFVDLDFAPILLDEDSATPSSQGARSTVESNSTSPCNVKVSRQRQPQRLRRAFEAL
jgi:hypothetical protein